MGSGGFGRFAAQKHRAQVLQRHGGDGDVLRDRYEHGHAGGWLQHRLSDAALSGESQPDLSMHVNTKCSYSELRTASLNVSHEAKLKPFTGHVDVAHFN